MGYSFNRKGIFPIKRILGFGTRWKWKGLGKDLGMTSHSGSKEEVIFFSFQTTKPRKKKTQAKTSEKQKKKTGPKIRLSHRDDGLVCFRSKVHVSGMGCTRGVAFSIVGA